MVAKHMENTQFQVASAFLRDECLNVNRFETIEEAGVALVRPDRSRVIGAAKCTA
jgi:hypothetical protein